jgi:hypothetical protein
MKRFTMAAIAVLYTCMFGACGVPEAMDGLGSEGGTVLPSDPAAQESVPPGVLPTCRINDVRAATRAEALQRWGEPCARDSFGDVETWYYSVTRCRLETMPGPLDDFCPLSCAATAARYAVTFTRDVVSECEAPALQPAVAPPTYTVTRYSHTDASTRLGAQCPGGAVLVGGSCSCAAPGTLVQSEMTGDQLQVMECACSSGGVTVQLACLSSDSATLRDGTP